MLDIIIKEFIVIGELLKKDIFLKDIIVILFAAKFMGLVARKLGLPSLFGKLIVGIFLGPSLLGILDSSLILNKLAETGVILLMFLAGLETDTTVFRNNLQASTLAAFGGIFLPLLGGASIALIWGYNFTTALFIGVILIATSVSISVETLREMGKLQTEEGYTILGAAVLDDILGLIILSAVLNYATNEGQIVGLQLLILKIVIFFILVIVAGYLLLPLIFKFVLKELGTLGKSTLALIITFSFALMAEYFGLAGIVGAYLSGIILGQSKLANQKLFENIEILGHSFFFPIFFVSIGITAEINGLTDSLIYFTIIATLVAVITKVIGAGSGVLLAGKKYKSALGVGIGMISRGEVALIVANIGLNSGIISTDLYTAMIIITILTTVITPLLIKVVFEYI